MKKSLLLIQFAGFVFISLLGTLLHFLYDLTNESILFAPFSAVNESIFEHIKLFYFSLLIFSFIESFYLKGKYRNFWCSKAKAFTVGIVLIPAIFYTYTGALGVYADWFNILIFFISAAISFIVDTKSLKNAKDCIFSESIFKIYILLLGILFIIFTFLPIEIPLFLDRQTNTYGIK